MTDWQTLTAYQSHHVDFSSLSQQACFMPLPQLSVINISGDDASDFLQNLVTNDVKELADNQAQYAGLCNPKGRLMATFIIVKTGDNQFYLILANDLCDAISKRLSMYVLRSKVTVATTQELTCYGLTERLPNSASLNDYNATDIGNTCYIKLPSILNRYLVIGPTESINEQVQDLLSSTYQLVEPDYWQWLDIQAGIGHVVADSTEQFTPQQLNLDLNEGVSFSKGCYPGQEVVARLHYLGNPNRRLFSATAESSLLAKAGSEFYSAEQKVAGHIVTACQHNDGHLDCLVSLKLSELDAELHLEDKSKMKLTSKLD